MTDECKIIDINRRIRAKRRVPLVLEANAIPLDIILERIAADGSLCVHRGKLFFKFRGELHHRATWHGLRSYLDQLFAYKRKKLLKDGSIEEVAVDVPPEVVRAVRDALEFVRPLGWKA